jgi:hypothetical protein
MRIKRLPLATLDLGRFRDVLGPEYAEVEAATGRAAAQFAGRVVWRRVARRSRRGGADRRRRPATGHRAVLGSRQLFQHLDLLERLLGPRPA